MYNVETGEVRRERPKRGAQAVLGKSNSRKELIGLPLLRLPTDPLPCHSCAKIPKGEAPEPESAQEWLEHNLMAYRHWQECKAMGGFTPDERDDWIVRRNAVAFQMVHDEYALQPMRALTGTLARKMAK